MRIRPFQMKRKGTTAVEMAVVLVVFIMMFMGVLEYGLYFFTFHVANNAVREGARYAVVRTGNGTTTQQVITFVQDKMAGQQARFGSTFNVAVENADPATGEDIPNTVWQDSQFGGAIRVRITGSYRPIMPVLFFLPTTFSVETASVMGSEGN